MVKPESCHVMSCRCRWSSCPDELTTGIGDMISDSPRKISRASSFLWSYNNGKLPWILVISQHCTTKIRNCTPWHVCARKWIVSDITLIFSGHYWCNHWRFIWRKSILGKEIGNGSHRERKMEVVLSCPGAGFLPCPSLNFYGISIYIELWTMEGLQGSCFSRNCPGMTLAWLET